MEDPGEIRNSDGGRRALVTGASKGVGLAVVRRLAMEGARIALVARGAEALEAAAEQVRRAGAEAIALRADVSKLDECARVVSETVAAFGGLDLLVNNAGAHVRGTFAELAPADVATMVDVNTRAPLVLIAHALPHLARAQGSIVNVASIAGMAPLPGAAVYSGTKFALRAFSIALREELKDSGVSVSLVSPGPIEDTGFLMDHVEEAADILFAQPMSTADEIAELVIASARDGRRERATPLRTSLLASASYLVPGLRSVFEPMIRRRGARNKARLLERRRR